MSSNYLLVAFDVVKEKVPGYAMRKAISRGDFRLLSEDIRVDVELNDIPYTVTDKRSFAINISGCQHLVMIIDVEKK